MTFRRSAAPLLRVAMVADSPSPSGVGEHMLTLAGRLRDRCAFMFLLSDAPGATTLAQRAQAEGHAVNRLDADHLRCWPEIAASRLRPFAPGLVHVHAGVGWEGNRAGAAAKLAGAAATVRTEHLPYVLTDRVQRQEHAEGLADVERVICVSNAVLESHARAGLTSHHMVVVRNGVEHRPPVRPPEETRAALGLTRMELMVLTVARFTPQKGHGDLLQAAREVAAAEPRARFVWVGSGPLQPALKCQAHVAGVPERVLFAGVRSDIPDLLAAADLFVLPSLFEGLPLALLEAMLAGVPVVATDAPGTTEVVTGDTGRVVAVGNPAALAAVILDVPSDPAEARRMGERGRDHARKNFSAERMAEETWAVYLAALADAGQGASTLERRRA